jgi:hypothetical protein
MNLDPVQIALGVTAVIAALVAIGKLVQTIYRAGRKIAAFLDEVTGEPAAYGRPARPGLVEKVDTVVETQAEHTDELAAVRRELETVKHELFPNSGLSLRDAVDRLEKRAGEQPAVNVNVHPPTDTGGNPT